jgi:hypothetical protein
VHEQYFIFSLFVTVEKKKTKEANSTIYSGKKKDKGSKFHNIQWKKKRQRKQIPQYTVEKKKTKEANSTIHNLLLYTIA